MSQRSTADVFHDHLEQAQRGTVEEDVLRNYAEDVIIMTGRGVFHGHDGVRTLARLLREDLPGASFTYRTRLVAGEVAFLEWTAHSARAIIDDGADSYVIREGRIVIQTIHYTVRPRHVAAQPRH